MNPSRRDILKVLAALPLTTPGRSFSKEIATPVLIRINIPGPHSLPFLPLELIPILGLDHSLGAQLVIRYFPSGVRALEDMLAGNAQFSAQGFTVLHGFYNKGKHALALAPLSGLIPPFGLVVRSDLRSQVKTVADLRGRSIGISVGSVNSKTYSQQVAEVFLAANGVKPDEVRWVPTAQNWDGQFGALSSQSVDAVYCEEPFMSGLVRKKAGYVLVDFSDAGIMAKLPGAAHIRATLTTSAENHKQQPELTARMLAMLEQSLQWMSRTAAQEIVNRLAITDQDEKNELTEVLLHHKGMYASDTHFSPQQVEATAQFMRAAGLLDAQFDLNTLIARPQTGAKP
jgi:NitT/TauT family transport system substrate-binding protein